MTDEIPPSDEFVQALRRALGAFDAPRKGTGEWRADMMWARFTARWKREDSTDRGRVREVGRSSGARSLHGLGAQVLRQWMWPVSAALAMLIVYVLVRPTVHNPAEVTTTYATHAGQEATVTLTDGSRAMLGPNTTLRLTRFGTRSRLVELNGEAYVNVAHTSGAPFLVRSNGVIAQVLGTSFLMRHFPGERYVHVAVADGKVRVQPSVASSTPVVLVGGRIADVSDSTIKTIAIDDRAADADWEGGKLSFHDRPLSEVLSTLSRWYGYEFHVTDSTLAHERVTLVLTTHSTATVFALLEQLLSVNLTVVGDTVMLAPQSPHSSGRSSRLHNYDVWTPTREVGR